MHAAGVRSLADVVIEELDFLDRSDISLDDPQAWESVRSTLDLIAPSIAWSFADAEAGNETQRRHWQNDIGRRQNTNQDISELTTFLKRLIKKARKTPE